MTYIFDFDGTLVDSMPTFSKVMLSIFDENNLCYPSDVLKIITPLGYKGTAEYAISLGLEMSVEEFIKEATQRMKYEYHNIIAAKEHVKETLIYMKKIGHSLNVLTASPHDVLDACLKRLGLFELFDNVWSCDDFNLTKADTQIYEQAASKLGIKVEDCTFVDDNINAVATAKKSGMISVGIFDKSSEDFVEDMKIKADKYVYTFDELIN